MRFRSNLVPAKQQHGEKARLEKKREDTLGRERAAEDVADIARIGGPVGPELELHYDAGRHADGEGQREHLRPETRHLVVQRVFRLQPQPLHDHQQHAEPDAQRREEIMKRDCEGELQAREPEHVHGAGSMYGRQAGGKACCETPRGVTAATGPPITRAAIPPETRASRPGRLMASPHTFRRHPRWRRLEPVFHAGRRGPCSR